MRNPFLPPPGGGPRKLVDIPVECIGGPKDGEIVKACIAFGFGEYGAPRWNPKRKKMVALWIRPKLDRPFGS